jgi:hypothetical protein
MEVKVSIEVNRLLIELRNELNISNSDIIGLGIEILSWVIDLQKKGYKVTAEKKQGRRIKNEELEDLLIFIKKRNIINEKVVAP